MSILINGKPTSVFVYPIPVITDKYLKFTKEGNSLTLNNIPGTIFTDINNQSVLIEDNVNPTGLYHEGFTPIDQEELKFFDCENVNISNEKNSIVSELKEKGLFEIKESLEYDILDVFENSGEISISVSSSLILYENDTILITGNYSIIPNGIYTIKEITAGTNQILTIDLTIDPSSFSPYLGGSVIKKYTYYWDEVLTTPLGVYSHILNKGEILTNLDFPGPGVAEIGWYYSIINNVTDPITGMSFTAGQTIRWNGTLWVAVAEYWFEINVNEMLIKISDPNIIPKINDYITLQKNLSTNINFTNSSTTDGINSVINPLNAEFYVFKITNVSNVGTSYYLTLDKSFNLNVTSIDYKFVLTLLNRGGTTANKDLYKHTWSFKEIHQEQLLGDPFISTGTIQIKGRTNFLNYNGSEHLGFLNQIKEIIGNKATPVLLLHCQDEIKDRINPENTGELEVHFPNLLIQNERTPGIFTDRNVSFKEGIGFFSELVLKYPSIIDKVYGYVFHDLRFVVITEPDVVLALGYNSNRNYSLASFDLPLYGNSLENSTALNPLLVYQAIPGTPCRIVTMSNHNLSNGDAVAVADVLGISGINVTLGQFYYAQVIDSFTIDLFQNQTLTLPVSGTGSYLGGGILYSKKLPFEYFITYRLKTPHYETLPFAESISFNFQTNGTVDNTNGAVQIDIEQFSHLLDVSKSFGFEANDIEIIIGKHRQSLSDYSKIDGIDSVKIVKTESLFDGSGVQKEHSIILTKNEFNSSTTNYNLLTSTPIYNLPNIPSTLFVGENIWTIGNIKHVEQTEQYRLIFNVKIPASKWNGTTNPTYEPGNNLMLDKLISEISFMAKNTIGEIEEGPYVYAKIEPAVKKTNQSDIHLIIQLDF